jgi:hypothetical protein
MTVGDLACQAGTCRDRGIILMRFGAGGGHDLDKWEKNAQAPRLENSQVPYTRRQSCTDDI